MSIYYTGSFNPSWEKRLLNSCGHICKIDCMCVLYKCMFVYVFFRSDIEMTVIGQSSYYNVNPVTL